MTNPFKQKKIALPQSDEQEEEEQVGIKYKEGNPAMMEAVKISNAFMDIHICSNKESVSKIYEKVLNLMKNPLFKSTTEMAMESTKADIEKIEKKEKQGGTDYIN